MTAEIKIADKNYITENYRMILESGPMSHEDIQTFLRGEGLSDEIVVQSTSGSTGEPLRIPRTRADVGDIARRVVAVYVKHYGSMPDRIALFGGISHMEAAVKLKSGGLQMRSFEPGELRELVEFNPDVISCYPSVARELISTMDSLPALKAIKLGGEPIFQSDINRLLARNKNLIVIEQYGSTEMPAVALRLFTAESRQAPYILQTERFSFLPFKEGWSDIVVRDNFPDLLFSIGRFYDMGDEMRIEKGQGVEVRRRGDTNYHLRPIFEKLFESGCVNAQIDMEKNAVIYSGKTNLAEIEIEGKKIPLKEGAPIRLRPSNKMPLLIGQYA